MLSIKILLAIQVVSLLIERQSILKIKYKIHFFNLILHNVDSYHFISFWVYEGCYIWSASTLTLKGCDLEYFIAYDQFLLLISKSLDILI
jgi:hypothetical protein